MFIIMFIIMPTFVASIINSYFNANLRKLSLISEEDLGTPSVPPEPDADDALANGAALADPRQL